MGFIILSQTTPAIQQSVRNEACLNIGSMNDQLQFMQQNLAVQLHHMHQTGTTALYA